MKRRFVYRQTITTAADGSAVAYFGSHKINGRIVAVKYEPGDSGLDTGADLTLTGETSGQPILTKANAGTSTVWFYPKAIPHKVADGSALTDATADLYLFEERAKLEVAEGGDAKTGVVTLYTEEDA